MPRQFLPRPPQPLVRGSGLAHGRAGHAAVNSLSRAVSGGVAVAAASSSASHRDRHLGRHCFQTHGQECSRCDKSVQIPRFRSHFLSLSLSLPCVLENTSCQDLARHQGDSETRGDCSAAWPAAEQMGPAGPSPQQPFHVQPGSYPAGGGSGPMAVPVPLYSVPETRLPGTGGGTAVTEAPGGVAGEGTQRTHPPPGKSCTRLEARSVCL